MLLTARPAARLIGALVLAAGALATAQGARAGTDERSYLSKTEIQASLIGKEILSKNLASGKLSHWAFRADGTVEAAGSLGRATGTWTIRDDGQMCVTLVGRTGCRYWFRTGDSFANADSKAPDARTVAQVRLE